MPLIKFRSLYTEHRAIYSYTVHGNVIAIIDHDEGKSEGSSRCPRLINI